MRSEFCNKMLTVIRDDNARFPSVFKRKNAQPKIYLTFLPIFTRLKIYFSELYSQIISESIYKTLLRTLGNFQNSNSTPY